MHIHVGGAFRVESESKRTNLGAAWPKVTRVQLGFQIGQRPQTNDLAEHQNG